MDKTTKKQVLHNINELTVADLLQFIHDGDIGLEEMVSSGLDRSKLSSIQEQLNYTDEKENIIESDLDEIKELCAQIENDELDVFQIRELILEGIISAEQLKEYTSMTDDIIDRIIYYNKEETPFDDWENLPQLEKNRTDIFFFGQPGSGKSCVLGSLFHSFDKKGLLIENMSNIVGTRYRNQLKDEFNYGILPDSTAEDGVNYMPLELRNIESPDQKHPLNFVEMSGELFEKAYQSGIDALHPKIIEYLSNSNRKILFFVIDYDTHKRSKKISFGANQSSKLTSVLELLDNYGTLSKTDAVYILVTKSDLFPDDVDSREYAKQFMELENLNFTNNLKEKKERYSNSNKFSITVFPYSIGKVKFKSLVVEKDLSGAEFVTRAIQKHAFITRKKSFLKRYL